MSRILITSPNDATRYAVVSGIMDHTSREVLFHTVVGTDVCPVCSGGDPFCVLCHGNPSVEIIDTVPVRASIRWNTGDIKKYRPEGQYIDGDCLIIILYISPSLNPYVSGTVASGTDYMLHRTKLVTVDNRQLVIHGYYFKGTPVNRVHIVLREDEGDVRVG